MVNKNIMTLANKEYDAEESVIVKMYVVMGDLRH